jgi:serine/threonine protein phosphatase PrpC
MNFSIHQASHIGNRKFNQDRVAYSYSNDSLLLVLADGMGGHLHGEMAAGSIIEAFTKAFANEANPRILDPKNFLSETMHDAHERIMRFPYDAEKGGFPGSTCVAALIQDGKIYWGHAGDSRLYLLRDNRVLTRTQDHSLVCHWVELGMITADEARTHPQRNQITNCLGGTQDMFYIETGKPIDMLEGDVILLGSDGLWGPFLDSELVDCFASNPIAETLENLVQQALHREAGHSDNVTGIAIRWGKNEPARDTPEPVSHILEIA